MNDEQIKNAVQLAIDKLEKEQATKETPHAKSLEDIVEIVSLDCKQFSADLLEQTLINLFSEK